MGPTLRPAWLLLAGLLIASVGWTPLPALGDRPSLTGGSSDVVPSLSVAITANTTRGSAPLYVFFTATVEGATLSSVTFRWSFGDNSTAGGMGASWSDLDHVYSENGTFLAVVNVSAPGEGAANNSISITVEASSPPPLVVSIEATPLTNAPLTVYFVGTATGGTGSYTSYLWSFGNGATGDEPDELESYNASGTYHVILTVTDSGGVSASRTVLVNVSAPGGSSPGVWSTWGPALLDLLPWLVAIVAVLVAMAFALRSRKLSEDVEGPTAAGPSGTPALAPESLGSERVALEASQGATSSLEPRPEMTSAGTTPAPGMSVEPSPARTVPTAPVASAAAPPTAPELLQGPETATSTPGEPAAQPSPPGPKVASETLRLSFRLVLHIASQGALGTHEVAPQELTQSGMSKALGAKQNTIATLLKRLEVAGIVASDVRHVRGAPRRMKVYRLTVRGEALARDIRTRRASDHAPSSPE